MKKLYGVTVAMITPFDGNGKVDRAALSDLTGKLINKGVQGLYPCGTTGEMVHLSVKEREEVAETVIGTAAGRVNVFVHCGAADQEDTKELALHALKHGADGIGVVTPIFHGVTDNEMYRYYKDISAILPKDFPIYLYNIPQCSGNDLKAQTAGELAEECENIVGIKYSFPDIQRTLEYLQIPSFSVLHGWDKILPELLLMGCDGTVSGVAGVFPEPFVAVYDAWKNQDIAAMQKWQKVCIRFCDLLRSGTNMSWFKKGLALRGVAAGNMRPPQLNLPEGETEQTMKALAALCEESGIALKM